MVFGFGIVLIFVWSPWPIFVRQRAIFWNKLKYVAVGSLWSIVALHSPPLVMLVGALPWCQSNYSLSVGLVIKIS